MSNQDFDKVNELLAEPSHPCDIAFRYWQATTLYDYLYAFYGYDGDYSYYSGEEGSSADSDDSQDISSKSSNELFNTTGYKPPETLNHQVNEDQHHITETVKVEQTYSAVSKTYMTTSALIEEQEPTEATSSTICTFSTTAKEFQEFFCKFLRYQQRCENMLKETVPTNGTFCPGDFDGFMCWPHANASSLVMQPCPDFVVWNNDSLNGYRYCNADGTWFKVPGDNESVWGHRDQCNPFTQSDSLAKSDLIDGEENLLNTLKTIYTIGYAVSLVCLVVALFLLVSFKKLHCTRNYIHINLMLSFMIRYIAVLVKDAVIQEQYSPNKFADDVTEAEMKTYCDEFGGTSGIMISCRVVIALMHYAVVANYFWLLVEGLYLLILLVFTMKDHQYFPAFMAFGWGGPWIPVGVWVVLHLALENVGCWELDETSQILWTLRAPIIISIGANFCIFIFIVRIIVSKLRAKNMTRNDYKYRLAKSTLALIPLLGIHYIVFIFVNDDDMELLNIMVKVKVSFEMILTSIQGTLIALLYCFLNGEVKSEVKKLINKWRLKHGLPAVIPRKSSTYNSCGTQVTTLTLGHGGDNNHKDTIHLSPADKRNSTISGRRLTDTSGDQSIGTLEGVTEPLIKDSRVDIHSRKNDEFV